MLPAAARESQQHAVLCARVALARPVTAIRIRAMCGACAMMCIGHTCGAAYDHLLRFIARFLRLAAACSLLAQPLQAATSVARSILQQIHRNVALNTLQ